MLDIIARGEFDAELSTDLNELATLLSNEDLNVSTNSVAVTGLKSGLIIGISIATLVVGSVGTVVSLLSFFQEQKKKYRLTIEAGGRTAVLGNPDSNSKAADLLQSAVSDPSGNLKILVEKV